MRKRSRKAKPQPATLDFGLKIFAGLVGCILAGFSLWWIGHGRIDYSTGLSESHHFVATPETSPGSYWSLILVFGAGAFVLWSKIIVDLIIWIRSGRSAG
jgi:hypothetical protein